MSKLDDLEQRLVAATGRDDGRLCAEIACHFIFTDLRPSEPTDFDGKYGYQPHNIKCEHGFLMARNYTSSLDDALELLERVLPGWGYFIRKDEEGHNAALLYPHALRVTPGCAQHASTPALALLLAIVRALRSTPPPSNPGGTMKNERRGE